MFLARLKYKDTALLITSNKIKLIKPKGKKFTLKELQNAVDGHIEIAQNIFSNYLTVVNEEGLIYNMPFNELSYFLFDEEFYGNVLLIPKNIFE